ncbi:hypothetical protein HDE_06547 [Halotydeus destructor]|nr:hypothetical protein HDE_06547 [Halotydeus destructor]
MSSFEETPELKAGHAPAVKVGGMRVTTQNRTRKDSNEPKPVEPVEVTEEEEDTTVAEKTKEPSLVVSGAVADQSRDFPPAAIKAFHDKGFTPNKAYGLRDNAGTVTQMRQVHQPRKNC